MEVPENIKQKIAEKESSIRGWLAQKYFTIGAEFGYSLAQQENSELAESMVQLCKNKNREIKERDTEIERLKSLIWKIYGGMLLPKTDEEFGKKYNL